ncbi:hypothetical protein BDR26DRAFT_867356 [Obelidium mucronatum]|nr:hypothetical protein BDR26DRAFT_867356 [Obelidium mucronatum]
MPIAGLPDPSFVHVLCAIWNPEIGLGKQDEHIKVEKFMLYLNHPCSFCSEKTGLRVKCSKSGCVHRFHISCAIKGGSLAKTAPTALICGNHGKLEAESPSAGTQRPSSASSIMRPFSSGSKGDLKDWEAAREEKRRLAAAAETSGAPTNSKRRVLDSDEASSDVDQPAEKKQKRAESASVTKGKRAKQTISSDYEEEEEDMEEGAAGEEKGRDANESSEDESNINKSNNNQSSKNFKSASNGKNNHTGNSSTLAADIFGKDALQTRKLTSSQPQSNQTRRISEINTNRSKGLPPGLMKQRDMYILLLKPFFASILTLFFSSLCGPEPTVETFKAIIRAQDKVCQDLKGFLPTFNRLIPTKQASQSSIAIPNTTQPPLQSQPQSQTQPASNQAQPPQQQVSALDALLNKAHETSELNALKRELESYKSKLALKDTALVSLRANLCLIFNQLKLSAVTPDESSVDEYVSMLRDLLKN